MNKFSLFAVLFSLLFAVPALACDGQMKDGKDGKGDKAKTSQSQTQTPPASGQAAPAPAPTTTSGK